MDSRVTNGQGRRCMVEAEKRTHLVHYSKPFHFKQLRQFYSPGHEYYSNLF